MNKDGTYTADVYYCNNTKTMKWLKVHKSNTRNIKEVNFEEKKTYILHRKKNANSKAQPWRVCNMLQTRHSVSVRRQSETSKAFSPGYSY